MLEFLFWQYSLNRISPFFVQQNLVKIADSFLFHLIFTQSDLPVDLFFAFCIYSQIGLTIVKKSCHIVLNCPCDLLFKFNYDFDQAYYFVPPLREAGDLPHHKSLYFFELPDEVSRLFELLVFGLLDQFPQDL